MKSETRQRTLGNRKTRHRRPENLGKPQMKWGSDVVAEVTRRLNLKYIALVPGASYRGFHDKTVNYLGNSNPRWSFACTRSMRFRLPTDTAKLLRSQWPWRYTPMSG